MQSKIIICTPDPEALLKSEALEGRSGMGSKLWLLCLQGSEEACMIGKKEDECMIGKKEDEFVGVLNMDQLVMANGKLDYL